MAITGHITVAPEELSTQSTQVQSLAGELKDRFNEILNLVSSTEHYWTGEASQVHRQNFSKHTSTLEEIVARYNEHARDLESMAGIYQNAETQATTMAEDLPLSTL